MYIDNGRIAFAVPGELHDRTTHVLRRSDQEAIEVSYLYLRPGVSPMEPARDRQQQIVRGLAALSPSAAVEETLREVNFAGASAALLAVRVRLGNDGNHTVILFARSGAEERVEVAATYPTQSRAAADRALVPAEFLALVETAVASESHRSLPRPRHGVYRWVGRYALAVPPDWSTPRAFTFESSDLLTRIDVRAASRADFATPHEDWSQLFGEDDVLSAGEPHRAPLVLESGLHVETRTFRVERTRPSIVVGRTVVRQETRDFQEVREAYVGLDRQTQLTLVGRAPSAQPRALADAWQAIIGSLRRAPTVAGANAR